MSTPNTSDRPLLPHLLTDPEGQTGTTQEDSLIKQGQTAVEEQTHQVIQGYLAQVLVSLEEARCKAVGRINEHGLPIAEFKNIFDNYSTAVKYYDQILRDKLHACVYNAQIGITSGSDYRLKGHRGWNILDGEFPVEDLDPSCRDHVGQQQRLILAPQYKATGKFLRKKRVLFLKCCKKVQEPLREDCEATTTGDHVKTFFGFLEKKMLKYATSLQGDITQVSIFCKLPQILPSESFLKQLTEAYTEAYTETSSS